MHYFGEAVGKDGEADNGIYSLDRLVAHELTHAVMKANVNYFDYLPAFVKEGMAELTVGIDDENYNGIKALASNPTHLKKALSLSDYSTIKISDVQDPTYAAGYMFLRYLAKQASTRGKYINNSTAKKSVAGTSNEDTIKNSASGVTISGKGGNDLIQNNGGSNVTISGDGKDVIFGFENNDLLQITGTFNDPTYNASKNSVAFKVGSGSITLKDFGSTTLFHVNSSTYEFSGGKLTKK